MDNAVTHGDSGIHVATRVARVGGTYELVVEDDGRGVPAEQRQSLGRRFFRGGAREGSGSGLGLSLVQRIVELHGAVIEYGEGSNHRGLRVSIRFASRDV